ncbi:MAG TPA: LD-carboxypeptidase [Gemmatimonadales bacterium]|nr:LD-carboxypeptidase [Gemmatimonadales bacterium]
MTRSKSPARPPKLAPGARIAIVAPSAPCLELDDFARADELCRALGYEPAPGRHLRRRDGYLAGTDEERAADLNDALRDDRIDAIWCVRGGYGLTRILDRIDYDAARRRPKAIIGFSDVTALLNAMLEVAGIVTFHGPTARAAMPPFSRWHFDRVLTAPGAAGRLGRLPQPADVLVPKENRIVPLAGGVAEGPLVGGNLTLLQCLIGTRYLPDLDGAILFLEDVGEPLYRVDRMLAHLRAVGALGKLAGVAVGRFTEMKREMGDGAFGFDEVLGQYLAPLRIPVALGFPVGHIDDQWTLPLGVRARLDATAGDLELLEPAVR